MSMNKTAIRVGNQTNCNVAARLTFEFAVKNGFDAFEWFSDPGLVGWCEDSMSDSEIARIKTIAAQNDILCSVHAPWRADPTTPHGLAEILRSIRFAGKIGAGLVNFHMFPQYEPFTYVEAIRPLIGAAIDEKVRLSIENTPQSSPASFNAIFAILENIPEAAGKTGMCLDMGHANLFPETRNDYVAYVNRLTSLVPIIHWHAHENFGSTDDHIPLFRGPSAKDDGMLRQLFRLMQKRKFCGSVVMEQWPNPPEVLVNTRNRFLQLWNEEFLTIG